MVTSQPPLVSVLLLSYNRPAMLGEAISSALGQTYRRVEVIVADDASTEDRAGVVAGFGDPRLRFGLYARNIGVAANVSAALAEAQGTTTPASVRKAAFGAVARMRGRRELLTTAR
jgi:glycosyltransferase involved in cell wall biosynthesis